MIPRGLSRAGEAVDRWHERDLRLADADPIVHVPDGGVAWGEILDEIAHAVLGNGALEGHFALADRDGDFTRIHVAALHERFTDVLVELRVSAADPSRREWMAARAGRAVSGARAPSLCIAGATKRSPVSSPRVRPARAGHRGC